MTTTSTQNTYMLGTLDDFKIALGLGAVQASPKTRQRRPTRTITSNEYDDKTTEDLGHDLCDPDV